MKKTFGLLKLKGDQWELSDIMPHVAIRLKQLFPRIPKWQTGTFTFPNDTIHCADLSWFISRYPMEMTEEHSHVLEENRIRYEQELAVMENILRPDYIPSDRIGLKEGQKIRHYQAQAIDLALARLALLLADGVGLGKTYAAAGLLLEPRTLPAAVVVQTHLQLQWQEKIEGFTTLKVHKIKGTRPYDLPVADVYIFKYSQLLGWVDTFDDGFFKTVVYDEIQELRTGLSSGKGEAAKKLSDNAKYKLGLSATPIYGYGAEIWNIMSYLDKNVLGSYSDFLREWCINDKQVRDPDALGGYLREQNILLRRNKKDVGGQLPPINSIIEYVESDTAALKSVEDLARQLAIQTTTGSFLQRGRAGRQLDLLVRHATGVSKAHAVAHYAKIFLESNIPVLISGWHRDVYSIWLTELADYNPLMYTGSETDKQKNESLKAFLAGESNLFILSLRSGAGVDGLQYRCSTVIHGELDWTPKVHDQVIGRLDREGQQEEITSIYLISDEGSDPPMVELLGLKSSQSNGIVDPGQELQSKHSDKSRIKALANLFLSKKQRNGSIN